MDITHDHKENLTFPFCFKHKEGARGDRSSFTCHPSLPLLFLLCGYICSGLLPLAYTSLCKYCKISFRIVFFLICPFHRFSILLSSQSPAQAPPAVFCPLLPALLSSDRRHLLLSGMRSRHGCCLLLPSA